jgi:uncharacterized protein (DUF58 family)
MNSNPNPSSQLSEQIDQVIATVVPAVIALRWRSFSTLVGGQRRSRIPGLGYDLQRIKQFDPAGDDRRQILHHATAATGGETVYAKVTYGTTSIPIYVVVELSPSLTFGTVRASKARLAAELAAMAMAAAKESNDRAAFIGFNNAAPVSYLRPTAPGRIMYPALETILQPQTSAAALGTAGSGFKQALQLLPRRRTLVFIISDFLGLAPQSVDELRDAAAIHDVVGLVLQDRRERELPAGRGLLTLESFDGQRRTLMLNDKTRRQYALAFDEQAGRRAQLLTELGLRFTAVSTEEGEAAVTRLLDLFDSGTF